MSLLYNRLLGLCNARGITGYRMSKDAGVSVNLMTDLKSGRKKGISAEVADKLASYFNVTVGYLLGTEEIEKPAKPQGGLGELSEEEKDYIKWFREEASEKEKALVRMIVKGEDAK